MCAAISRSEPQDSRITRAAAVVTEVSTAAFGVGLVSVSLPQLLEKSGRVLFHELAHWRGYGAVCGFDPTPYLHDFCGPRQIVYPTRHGPPACSIITQFVLYTKEHGAAWSVWQAMTFGNLSTTPIMDQFPNEYFDGLAMYGKAEETCNMTSSALGRRLGWADSNAYYMLSGVFCDAALFTSTAFLMGYASGAALRSAHYKTPSQRAYAYAALISLGASLHLSIVGAFSIHGNASTDYTDIRSAAKILAVDRGDDADDLRKTFLTLLTLPPLIAPILGLVAAWGNSPINVSDDLRHSLGIEEKNTWSQTIISFSYPLAMMLPVWGLMEDTKIISHDAGQSVDALALVVGAATSIAVLASNGRRQCTTAMAPVPVPTVIRVLRGLEDTCNLTAGISFIAAAARELQGPPNKQSVESAFGLNPDYLVAISATAAGWVLGAARGLMERRFVRQHAAALRVGRVEAPNPAPVVAPNHVPHHVFEIDVDAVMSRNESDV